MLGYDGNEVYKAYTPKDEKFHTKIAKKEIILSEMLLGE